jgi:hypothetical protein
VLDEGAREEVLTITADDADNLQDVLKKTKNVFYDVGRRVLMLGPPKQATKRLVERSVGAAQLTAPPSSRLSGRSERSSRTAALSRYVVIGRSSQTNRGGHDRRRSGDLGEELCR